MNEQATTAELAKLEARAEWLTKSLNAVLGQRDEVLRRLQDVTGAHDQRPVAVR